MSNPWKDATPAAAFAEAERRIAEALDTDSKLLDLGDLPLEELPSTLAE